MASSPLETHRGRTRIRWCSALIVTITLPALLYLVFVSTMPGLARLVYVAPVLGLAIGASVVVASTFLRVRYWMVLGLVASVLGVAGYWRISQSGPAVALVADVDTSTKSGPVEWWCDLEPNRLEKIPSGVVIGKNPPAEWSQIVMIIRPRIESTLLPDSVMNLANSFSLCFLARIQSEKSDEGRIHRLTSIATGVGVKDANGVRIVSSSNQDDREQLGIVEAKSMSLVERGLDQVKRIARTPNLWVFDTPCNVEHQRVGHMITRRYAILASPATGRPLLVFWDVDRDTDDDFVPDAVACYRMPIGRTHVIRAELSERLTLDPSRLVMLTERPTSSELPIPSSLRGQLNRAELSEATIRVLEQFLTKAIDQQADAS